MHEAVDFGPPWDHRHLREFCPRYALALVACFRSQTRGWAWARATAAARSKTAPKPPPGAEQGRRRAKAARQRQSAERYEQLSDPSVSPADIAEILAAELSDRVLAADTMLLRGSLGVPAEEVTETARLLLERAAPEPPGIGALAVCALAAHLAQDEVAEHGYARELLARTDASRDPGQWLEVIRLGDRPGPSGRDLRADRTVPAPASRR
jgi:hypothetical protein